MAQCGGGRLPRGHPVELETKVHPKVRNHGEGPYKGLLLVESGYYQYCQTQSVNILTRVCRELTRLSRSKHTLVNILTIGQLEHP